MISFVHSAAMFNGEAIKVTLECSTNSGFAGITFVGNTGELINDAKERVKSALENHGFKIPAQKIIINFSPAEVRKNANHFDLAIAIGLHQLLSPPKKSLVSPSDFMLVAELGLDGNLRPASAVVPFFLCALYLGLKGIIVAEDNLTELRALLTLIDSHAIDTFKVLGFSSLSQVLQYFGDKQESAMGNHDQTPVKSLHTVSPAISPSIEFSPSRELWPPIADAASAYNFDDMVLNEEIVLALKTIATGMHHVFLRGAPGCGKSMFALRLPSILPKMNRKDHLEALKIHSTFFLKVSQNLAMGYPPFRAPHHQASAAAIIGTPEVPGEISLAHGGVLFLDEFPEFRRDLLESLREPLESGNILIVRANSRARRAAGILLVAAANECPCGWFGSKIKNCTCSIPAIQKYQNRISGPILNRIDIHLKLPEFIAGEQSLFVPASPVPATGQTVSLIDQIQRAVDFGKERNTLMSINFNRDIPAHLLIEATGRAEEDIMKLISKLSPQALNRRSMVRILRLARSIADVACTQKVADEHIELALSWQHEALKKKAGYEYIGL